MIGAGLINGNIRVNTQTVICFADKHEFADHLEMITYVYNLCVASGQIGDGLDLVKSQQRLTSFDYNFAFAEGGYILILTSYNCMCLGKQTKGNMFQLKLCRGGIVQTAF